MAGSSEKSKRHLSPEETAALEKLAARIRKLRKDKGYKNYEDFANKHDISRAQIGRYENGEDLRFSTLIKVINGLGVSIADFFSEGFE